MASMSCEAVVAATPVRLAPVWFRGRPACTAAMRTSAEIVADRRCRPTPRTRNLGEQGSQGWALASAAAGLGDEQRLTEFGQQRPGGGLNTRQQGNRRRRLVLLLPVVRQRPGEGLGGAGCRA